MADYDIGEAFNRIQDELISSMIRNMSHHRKLEKAEEIEYAQWQAEQLQALNEYIQNNQSRFKKPYKLMDKEINKAIRAAYKEGRMNEEIKILKAIKKGYNIKRPNKAMQAEFFTINERSLNAMLDEINTSVHNVQTAILRRADDEYRKALFNSQVYFESGVASLGQAVDMATKDMLARGLSCIQYRNGRMVGAAEYAEMALRTSITRAYLKGQAAMRDEWGINTVLVNKRSRACPKCIKWVNKVYYDDVWGNSKIPDDKYPRLSEAIAGGLYHPNCKDIHTTYFEGITNIPPPLTEEEIRESEAEYKREQHEKYIQRNIDKYKRMEKGTLEPEKKERYKQLKKRWQIEKKTFKNIDNSAESDIIKKTGLASNDNGGYTVPEHKPFEIIKQIDFDDKVAVDDELKSFEQKAVKEEIETACVIAQDGTVYKCYGTNDQVFPDSDLGDKLIGAAVTHNHPIEETVYSFSDNDLDLFIEYNLKKLRGCDEVYTYEFTRNADDIDKAPEVWRSLENYQHTRIINEAQKIGIGYRRWKND